MDILSRAIGQDTALLKRLDESDDDFKLRVKSCNEDMAFYYKQMTRTQDKFIKKSINVLISNLHKSGIDKRKLKKKYRNLGLL